MDLNIIEVLYITLILFTSVIGTLLSIVLYKLIKVLNVLMEIVEVYNRVRQIVMLYSQIPDIIFSYIKDMLLGKK